MILARRLAKLGHHVSIANSSGPESLTALAAEIGATPVSVVDAAQAGEIVILAIPTKAVAELPRGLFAGAAIYITAVEHPARLASGTEVALKEFAPSYHRATMMHASLAIAGCAAGVLSRK
jgi:predicted dinucleotide-binding enzyme